MNESTHKPSYVPDGLPSPNYGGEGAGGERVRYSPDELEQIEQLASIYLPITDIAAILEVPAEVLREDIANKSSDASARYRKGKATSKVKLYQQEMQLAQVGSPLALETTHKNLLDMEDDE